MASLVDLNIAGRVYPVACREGEEASLQEAARLVDAKCREAVAGLGSLSEARQFLFASLLLADQLVDGRPETAAAAVPVQPETPDPELARRAEALAGRLESLALHLETEAQNA